MRSAPTRTFITGAGSGLGRAFALALAKPGNKIVVSDVNLEGAEATAEQVEAAGAHAVALELDVSDADAVSSAMERVESGFLGPIDLMINNAGVGVFGRVGEVSLSDWRWVVDVNLWGVIHGCHAVVPRMRARGQGQIINIASVAGLLAPPELAPYNVTKAGVVALSESLHSELKKEGIHVTVVCPSFFETNIVSSARGSTGDPIFKVAKKLMTRSKIQAPEVAADALAAAKRNQLYAIPMSDAKLMWRLKRALPTRFQTVWAAADKLLRR